MSIVQKISIGKETNDKFMRVRVSICLVRFACKLTLTIKYAKNLFVTHRTNINFKSRSDFFFFIQQLQCAAAECVTIKKRY